MLKKKANNISVIKLKAILLLKADFNAANKIIFNTRLIPQMKQRDEILKEIVGERRSQSAIYIAINKRLVADILNQTKQLYAIISADALNYFD